MRVQAADGIQIPAEAGGTEADQQFVLTVMPDSFDKDTVWVLLRGGDQLYKGTVYRNPNNGRC